MHRGTGAVPAERLAAEVPLLAALPRRRFDTAYVEVRAGSMWPFPRSSGAACATRCHHTAWGQASKCAKRWRGPRIEIRWAGEHVATHDICDTAGVEVWDALHFSRSPDGRFLSRSRGRHLSIVVPDDPRAASPPLRLDIAGDVDVDVPDLARYETEGAGS